MALRSLDLMIGDWVLDGNVYAQVTSITCDGNVETTHNKHSNIELIEPITLTPEILEGNGFIKKASEDYGFDMYHFLVPTGYEKDSFTVQVNLYREPICGVRTLIKCWGWLPPYNAGMNDIHLCNANYVHDLQHALRICRINKEIEL